MESHEPFQVDSLDHVELYVQDRYAAAAWYEKVFGLTILKEYEEWCKPHGGPLMISSDGGATKLALFREKEDQESSAANSCIVAFRVSGAKFLEFIDRAAALDLPDDERPQLTRDDIANHDKSFSVYLSDPWGNRLEVTTYDVGPVHAVIDRPTKPGVE